jgi:hypothetical protein
MQKTFFILAGSLVAIASCSHPTPRGKRVSLVRGNVSLVLPDSNLIGSNPTFWPSDCGSCHYSRTYFFHNLDSTIEVGVTVKVYPDTLGRRWPWKWLFNEKRTRDEFTAMHRNFATIEKLTADSVSRAVTIDARFIRQKRELFIKEISIRQGQHEIQLNYFVPDNPQMREAVANSQASIFINRQYLAGPAESPQDFRDHP